MDLPPLINFLNRAENVITSAVAEVAQASACVVFLMNLQARTFKGKFKSSQAEACATEIHHVSLRNCAENVMTSPVADDGYAAPPVNSPPADPVV